MKLSEISGKITELLHLSSNQLSIWLEKQLSLIDQDWWRSLVLSSLSYQQSQRVERSQINSLSKLDLAALFRILDKNWYPLSQQCKFDYQDRNYVKEMQTVRNQWAHIDAAGIDDDDIYRDLDTIQRVLSLIDATSESISSVKKLKKQILSCIPTPSPIPAQAEVEKKQPKEKRSLPGEIGIKSMVALKSDPTKQGPILEMDGNDPGSRCQVFIDGQIKPFYISQL